MILLLNFSDNFIEHSDYDQNDFHRFSLNCELQPKIALVKKGKN